MDMSRKDWLAQAEFISGLIVGNYVVLARRHGIELGLWEALIAVGTALADQGEEALAKGVPEPEVPDLDHQQ